MQQCPFCMTDNRLVGGIALMTPAMIANDPKAPEPIVGACCVDCMGLIAITLDGLRNGRINALAEKYMLSGAIKKN